MNYLYVDHEFKKHKNFITFCWKQPIIPLKHFLDIVEDSEYQLDIDYGMSFCTVINYLYMEKNHPNNGYIVQIRERLREYINEVVVSKLEKEKFEELIKIKSINKRVKL